MAARFTSSEQLLQGVNHLVSVEPRLKPIIDACGGPPERLLYRDAPVFEALSKAIVEQQLGTNVARVIYGRFRATCSCGEAEELTPGHVLGVQHEQLRAAGLSGRKAEYLQGLARAFGPPEQGGHLTDAGIKALGSEELHTTLRELRGIGEWSVHMLQLFHLGHRDVMPQGDLAIRKGLALLLGLREEPRPQQVLDLTQAWAPYRSVGAYFLFRLLEAERERGKAEKGAGSSSSSGRGKARAKAGAEAEAGAAEAVAAVGAAELAEPAAAAARAAEAGEAAASTPPPIERATRRAGRAAGSTQRAGPSGKAAAGAEPAEPATPGATASRGRPGVDAGLVQVPLRPSKRRRG